VTRFGFVSLGLLTATLALAGCRDGGASKPTPTPKPSGSTVGEGGTTPAAEPVTIDPATVATVKGVVSFAGTPPKPQRIQLTADPFCVNANPNPVFDETVVVNDAGQVRDVVVYVSKGVEGMKFKPSAHAVVLNQKGCTYVPHAFSVMAGQPIDIRNSDGTLHNIHALPRSNPEFNFGQPRKDMSRVQKFSVPELGIRIKCDVHPWMSAYAYVFNHPFHAVSAADGSFTLTGLPPGEYTLTAQHETLGTKTLDITLSASETREVTFSFGN
jgi:hypothetical protein